MNLEEIEILMLTKMCENELGGWTLEWDNSKTHLGLTYTRSHRIVLSKQLIKFDKTTVNDVCCHELAHAITGEGHTASWRVKCLLLGGNGRAEEIAPDSFFKWTGMCKSGHIIHRHRLHEGTRGGSCASCHKGFSREHMFNWVMNF